MNCTAWTQKLHDFVDGNLAERDARTVETHLATCVTCQSELESLRALRRATAHLPREFAPKRDLWPAIQLEIQRDAPAHSPSVSGTKADTLYSTVRWLLPLGIAAAIALLATVMERRRPVGTFADRSTSWSVAAIAGSPRVAARRVVTEAPFRVGQWLETDARSRARVAVGSIGEVDIEPNSRVRMLATTMTDHRIELRRGTLNALIWAPPRIFFVDTPSATAVDLGCAYTLSVADDGSGELHVTAGYVALEYGERESIIPAGLKCLTRPGAGPGTPFAADASDAWRNALSRFDFSKTDSVRHAALHEILTQAREQDGATLWHLLARTSGEQRSKVFDTLARHHQPPAGVTRAGIMAGDITMRHAWAGQLGLGDFANR